MLQKKNMNFKFNDITSLFEEKINYEIKIEIYMHSYYVIEELCMLHDSKYKL